MKEIVSRAAMLVLMFGLLVTFGCQGAGAPQKSEAVATKAIAVLYPTQGNNVNGTVTFTKVQNGVRVVANIQGLTPGRHGIHVHEFGDCTASDGTSAGEHFNPEGGPHAAPTAEHRHVGDLGNIEADPSGVAKMDYVDPKIAFEGEKSILGRSVVVHAKPDDLTSQPSGAAGARVACAVIGVSKP